MDGTGITINQLGGVDRSAPQRKAVVRFLTKLLKHRSHEVESFRARLQMETDAQARTAARLKAIEIGMKNQGRIK